MADAKRTTAIKKHRTARYKAVEQKLTEVKGLIDDPTKREEVRTMVDELTATFDEFHAAHEDYLAKKIPAATRKAAIAEYTSIREMVAEMKEKSRSGQQADEDEEDDDDESLNMESPPASMSSARSERLQIQAMSEMANVLRETLTAPRPSVLTFDGDPTHYYRFLSSFEAGVKSLSDPQIKLNYLIQNCTGDAKEAVEDCVILPPSEGYSKALEILKKRFGRPHEIARSYVRDLVNGPPMKPSDLNKFSVKMNRASMTLNQMGYRADLDNSENLLQIVRRLPMHLRSKWADKADSIIEDGEEPRFDDLAAFIERQARVASTMYGQDLAVPTKKVPNHSPTPRKTKGAAYHTMQGAAKKRKWSTECEYCGKGHQMLQCDAFDGMHYNKKRVAVRQRGLCDNCLCKGHLSRNCPDQKHCTVNDCSVWRKHCTALHPPRSDPPEAPQTRDEAPATATNNRRGETHAQSYALGTSNAVCLNIVPVKVKHGSAIVETYALLDNCSDVTLCADSLIKKLKVTGEKRPLTLTTMNAEDEKSATVVSMDVSPLSDGTSIHLDEVWAIDNLPISTDSLATQQDVDAWPHLKGIKLPKARSGKVELLIGGDVPEVFQVIRQRSGGRRQPYAVQTILGWTVAGPVKRQKEKAAFTANFLHREMTLGESVERMWQTDFNDAPSVKACMSLEDVNALKIMQDSTVKIDGHYQVALPWRNDRPLLDDNRIMAEKRMKSLGAKLSKDTELKAKYVDVMEGYLNDGYAREVPEDAENPKNRTKWYLPHHAVFHPKKPEKVRVVFDCAAKYNGRSLNDQLMSGPDLMNSLAGVLLRFRERPVAISSDIEAMFHQVRVDPCDIGALRFLWWKNGDLKSEPTEHQMLVHLFGAASSPSVCCYALRKTAEDHRHRHRPETIDTVFKNFYVDDCLKSVDTVEDAIKLQTDLTSLLEKGGFKLTKWLSSSKEVMASIPEQKRAATMKNLDDEPIERTLGVQWSTENDAFQFTPSIQEKPLTRRGLLSSVSSLFDPLGLVAPVTLTPKMLLQNLCRHGSGWDDEIDEVTASRWHDWIGELHNLANISIPRCYRPSDFGEISTVELHHFSDASEHAYGAVSYLRYRDSSGRIHCSIVIGKARLAPLKSVTIPRLELSAAVVAVRLNTMLKEELTIPVDKTYFWTDSTSVLQYIRNTKRRFKTFVANRLSAIHEGSLASQWRHVDTKQNPADVASRGLMPADTEGLRMWHNGPDFLWEEEENWPKQPANVPLLDNDDPEVKTSQVTLFTNKDATPEPLKALIERYSSWYRLQKAIAWLIRFKEYCRWKYLKQGSVRSEPLTVDDLKGATIELVKIAQGDAYKDDITAMKSRKGRLKGNLLKLRPYLDEDGVIRVGGRLQNAPIGDRMKHPTILPRKHPVTDLIINDHHVATGHSGCDIVLTSTRRRFWIVSGKSAVRRVLGKCMKCKKRSAPFGQQVMAPLPAARTIPERPPFSAVGVDYFGPILVKQGRSRVKRYGCLFTCMATRAVHIEIAHSLNTDSFLAALQRFISRRGRPEMIYSDNGTNFTSSNKELNQSLKALEQTKIHDKTRQLEIKWHFNPPAASHMGGVWERMIRTTRRILEMLLAEQVVGDECLLTLMAEVEKIMNDRPLTSPSSDATDLDPLTPNDLLLLRANHSIPPGVYDKLSTYSRRWYHQAQYLAGVFWKRWVREYLPTLQKRHKWHEERRNFEKNDLVLMADERLPRGQWPLARVLETYPDKNNHVRVVKIRTADSIKTRPVDKLCLLEYEL
jgi:hypothetical protein